MSGITPGRLGLPATPVLAHANDPVTEHVRAALDAQVRALLAHERGTRSGADPEELHQFRVAVRRMRAVLAVASPAVDVAWARLLRDELRWLGQALGPVRDLDVLVERLRAASGDLDHGDRLAVERLVGRLVAERVEARSELVGALRSRRFGRLLRALAAAANKVPAGRSAGVPLAVVRTPFRKLRRDVRALPDDPTDDALHSLRIRSKRLRYAAELVEPAGGEPVHKLIKAARSFQDILGDHQDACVAEQRIRQLVTTMAEPDPAVVRVADLLIQRERGTRARCRERWPAAWETLHGRAAVVLAPPELWRLAGVPTGG